VFSPEDADVIAGLLGLTFLFCIGIGVVGLTNTFEISPITAIGLLSAIIVGGVVVVVVAIIAIICLGRGIRISSRRLYAWNESLRGED
jgi:hypothetical protein